MADSIIAKIRTLFEDKEGTIPLFPRTKIKAVSDDDGTTLNVLLDDMSTNITAAMPKSGGTFTGHVTGCSTNTSSTCLRNIEVRTTSETGTLQSTNKIIMVRK